MAQLSSCHSGDSQDSEKPCFFIYSIYWYKDSSLRDTGECDIWSQVALMWNLKQAWKAEGRMTCKSSFCLLLGALTPPVCRLHTVCFEVEAKRRIARKHSHTLTIRQAHVQMQEERRPVAGENFTCVSHMTALLIIEPSGSFWSSLWCALRESLTCQTFLVTHIQAASLGTHEILTFRNRCRVVELSFFLFFMYVVCTVCFPQHEQMDSLWCASVHFFLFWTVRP